MHSSKDILNYMFQEGIAGTADLTGVTVDPNSFDLGFEVEMIVTVGEDGEREPQYDSYRLRHADFDLVDEWFTTPNSVEFEETCKDLLPEINEPYVRSEFHRNELFDKMGPVDYVNHFRLDPVNGWESEGTVFNGEEDELDADDYLRDYQRLANQYFDCEAQSDSSLHPDDSSSEVGMEFASEVFEGLTDGLKKIESAFMFINKYGYTNESCGFHITLGWLGEGEVDAPKLRHLLGDTAMGRDFGDRHLNSYTRGLPQHRQWYYRGDKTGGQGDSPDAKEKIKRVKDFSKDSYKYMAVNKRNRNLFEFRMFGGENYEQDLPKVAKWVNRAAQAMTAAASPVLKQKEYNKQLGYWADKSFGQPDPLAADSTALQSRAYKSIHPNAIKSVGGAVGFHRARGRY